MSPDGVPAATAARRATSSGEVTAILAGVAGSLRIGPARLASLPIAFARGLPTGAEEASYPIPAEDGATIDKRHEVILVRYEKAVYAFSLSCPHQKTPLRWQPDAHQRFQCPKHKSTLPAGRQLHRRPCHPEHGSPRHPPRG